MSLNNESNIFYRKLALDYKTITFASEEITPYKYADQEREKSLAPYDIPEKSRFTIKRIAVNAPDI